MKLIKCPKCGEIIHVDKVNILKDSDVIGCGYNKNDYIPCEECGQNNDPDQCKELRKSNGWLKTTVGDMYE